MIETTVHSISTKMYYVLSSKIVQGLDTASGTVLQKRSSRISGLNNILNKWYTYTYNLNNILILKYLEFLKIYMQVTEHFFHNSCYSRHKRQSFFRGFFSKFEDISN